MQSSVLQNPLLRFCLCLVGRLGLFVMGWKAKGEMPKLKKFVLIAAPHSSNWDFVLFLLIIFKFKIPAHWMGKQSMFAWPFKGLLKRLGGIPIDRSRAGNTVSQMAQAFEEADQLIITVAPSGTRSRVTHWKTGFYHLAREAQVPIVCGYVDYKAKTGGIGPVFMPQGDIDTEMESIKSFYHDKSGRYELV